MLRFKMAAQKRIFVSRRPKFEKKTVPVEFFNEIWLKVGEHEYIYIFEKKIENNYSVKKWRPNKICDIAQ